MTGAALTIAMAQLDLWVGDIDGNIDKIVAAARRSRDRFQADLVVCPEMALIGYPPDDLLFRRGMPAAIDNGLARIAREVSGIALVVGFPEYADSEIYNSAAVFIDGRHRRTYRKQRLPNYGVFDEQRHYRPGDRPCVFDLDGAHVGVTICEDLWAPGPAHEARSAGAEVLVNLNASPFQQDKQAERAAAASARAAENGLPVVYVNCVGGQDELVFDGCSMAFAGDGECRVAAPAFAEEVVPVALEQGMPVGDSSQGGNLPAQPRTYDALVKATRDYVERNGFPGVLVGLSGGIDSALTLAIAADAVGAERVWAVFMPSRYTAAIGYEDAAAQTRTLGTYYDEVAVESLFQSYLDVLAPLFGDRPADASEENLQARIRGTLLMALSNKFGHVVLAPGNKSEMAVGYATLYGDMCGGFAPLKDVYKTRVYELARYRNERAPVIPERVIERAPSAELRADQADSDSLPAYGDLDRIIEAYVEQGQSVAEICGLGYDCQTVRRIAGLIRSAEYKRRQAPPGPKVTPQAFGRERRYPITASYGDL